MVLPQSSSLTHPYRYVFISIFLPNSSINTDRRWITDDYYESKVLEDISAKGLQAGDLVGDLSDPNAPSHTHTTELSSLLGTSLDRSLGPTGALAGGGGATGGGGGVYRAGPTTSLEETTGDHIAMGHSTPFTRVSSAGMV